MRRHPPLESVLLAGLFLSGAAAMIYEIVWTRALSQVIGSSTYSLSIMLASFMSGLSIGAYLGGLWADKTKDPAFAFGIVEGGIAVLGFATFVTIQNLTALYALIFYTLHLGFFNLSFALFLLCFSLMLVPTTMMGATFPLVLKARTKGIEDTGREAGDAYSINNLGALAGAVTAGFLLIPFLGSTLAVFAAGLINLLASFSVLFLVARFRVLPAACLLILFISSIFYWTHHKAKLPFSFYTAERWGSYSNFKMASEMAVPVFQKEGIEGDVMLFAGDPPVLVSNGKFEGGGVPAHRLIAYLAMSSHPLPENVLNIGLGSGYTLSAISEWPVKKVVSLEINPSVVEATKRFIKPYLFFDRRINHVVADARNFLMLNHERYDVIVSVPSVPVESTSAALLTQEFFSIVAERLESNGLFAQWVDYYMLTNEDTRTLIRTFSNVFLYTTVWHAGGIIILVGSKEPFTVSPEDVRNKVEISVPNLKGLFTLGMTQEKVRGARWIEGKLNTDDLPILEFHAARNLLMGVKTIADGKKGEIGKPPAEGRYEEGPFK